MTQQTKSTNPLFLFLTCNNNNNNLTFMLRLKHAMQTQKRRSLHIGKTHDHHVTGGMLQRRFLLLGRGQS